MAKFYVESNQTRLVVDAQDAEGAALWMLNRSIESKDANAFSDQDCLFDGLGQLGSQIKVSQLGFGRDDAGTFETDELFGIWRTLVRSMSRLLEDLN